jgi:hypothetical protein
MKNRLLSVWFSIFSNASRAIVLRHYELYLPLADLGACHGVEDGHTDCIYRQEKRAIVQSERLQQLKYQGVLRHCVP